jgi:hypothetical protein
MQNKSKFNHLEYKDHKLDIDEEIEWDDYLLLKYKLHSKLHKTQSLIVLVKKQKFFWWNLKLNECKTRFR